MAVLRAGRCLGVVLNGEDGFALDAQAFVGLIEQADMRDFGFGG